MLALVFLLAAPRLSGSDTGVVVPATSTPAWWTGFGLISVQSAILLWRRTKAPLVLGLVSVAAPLGAGCGLDDLTSVTSLAVLVAGYAVASTLALRRAWPVLAAAGVLVAAGQAISRLHTGSTASTALGNALLQALVVLLPAVVVGVLVATRRDAQEARESRLLAVAGERAARLEAVVSNERMAMARELHDIAAHHLSGIAVMSAAIGPQIDTDPEAAKQAVALVRQQSRDLLRDLLSLVGLLRDDVPVDADAPSREHTLSSLAQLVEDATAAGLGVSFTMLRSTVPLGLGIGPLAQVAVYRIVGEALANVIRHAPGARCRVVVDDRGAENLTVTIINESARTAPTPDSGGGFGLVGMRERAALIRARLDYGPLTDGGWQVELTVPREPGVPPDAVDIADVKGTGGQ